MAPLALVHSICGLYHLADDGPPRFANHGFAEEFAMRLLAAGGAHGPVRMGRVWVLLTRPSAVAELAAEIVRETPGLEVRLQTAVSAAEGHDVTLRGTGVPLADHRPDTSVTISGRALVDATGDGVLAALLGAAFEQECGAPPATSRLHLRASRRGIRRPGGRSAAPPRAPDRARRCKPVRCPPGALGATLRDRCAAGRRLRDHRSRRRSGL